MNSYNENVENILRSGKCKNPRLCIIDKDCDKNKCELIGALQMVLEIPKVFPKAIISSVDKPARIFRYIGCIGLTDVKNITEGFTNEQYKAMLGHYGVAEDDREGPAISIRDNSLINKILKNEKPCPLDFADSSDPKIKKYFGMERAIGLRIPIQGEDVEPVLIIFLKKEMTPELAKNIFKDENKFKTVQIFMKDNRIKSLGELVSYIPDSENEKLDWRSKFSRWLLGWTEEGNRLWLGNKVWFVVDHELFHAQNLWNLVNELVKEHQLGDKLKNLNPINPLLISLAIWIHDIGYKGVHLEDWKMELLDIRIARVVQLHGIISAMLILNRREAYNLEIFDDNILALTGLICSFHQKGCPITKTEMEKRKDNYEIPDELKIDSDCKFVKEILKKCGATLKEEDCYLYLENLNFNNGFNNESLIVMASLLRLLDSCDFNRNRVGSLSMIKLREDVRDDNLRVLNKKFQDQLENCRLMVEKAILKISEDVRAMCKDDIVKLNDAKKNQFIPQRQDDDSLDFFKGLHGLFETDNKRQKIIDAFHLGRAVGHLKQQDHYYKVHNSVLSVAFKRNESNSGFIDLIFIIDNQQNEYILSKKEVANEIKKEIKGKNDITYNEVLKNKILFIKNVKPYNEAFDNWI